MTDKVMKRIMEVVRHGAKKIKPKVTYHFPDIYMAALEFEKTDKKYVNIYKEDKENFVSEIVYKFSNTIDDKAIITDEISYANSFIECTDDPSEAPASIYLALVEFKIVKGLF